MGPLDPPEPLAPRHAFRLSSRAFPSSTPGSGARRRGGARIYVACDGVAGFYSLAASSVARRRVSSRMGRNRPDPIPIILLGQLAVDENYRGRRLGSDLLVDAGRPPRLGAGERDLIASWVDAGADPEACAAGAWST